jgi:hypothetical protein
MRVRARLERLERRGPPGGAEGRDPPVEVWMPENGRDRRPPGRYPCPGSNAVLVIYQLQEPTPARKTHDDARRHQAPAGHGPVGPTLRGRCDRRASGRDFGSGDALLHDDDAEVIGRCPGL